MKSCLIFSAVLFVGLGYADGVDDYVNKKMAEDHLPGVVFAVVDPKGVVSYREYGVANLETGEKFSKQSVHRIASLSKQMCSFVALKLVKEGKLSLEDEVLKWFPQGPEHWKGIKVRHVMSHSSGIPDPDGFKYSYEYTLDEYIALIGKKPLDDAPGTKFRYNNYAYGLLGQLVGKAGNSTLPELANKYIFDPVGMKRTGYYVAGEKYPNEVIAYNWDDGKYVRAQRTRPIMFHGSGGVHASLEDMVNYELALRSGKFDKSLLDQQWTAQFPRLSKYGFGWYREDGFVRHTGTTFGYTSAFYREIPNGWTIILFRNANLGSQMDMAMDVLKLWRDSFDSK